MPQLTWAELAQAQGALNVIIDSRPLATAVDQLPQRPERGALIFPSWAAAVAFIASVSTRLGELQLLGSLEIPAGTWDLRGMTIAAAVVPYGPTQGGSQPTLTIPENVVLQNVAGFRGLAVAVAPDAGPVITYTGAGARRFGMWSSSILLSQDSTLIDIQGTVHLELIVDSSYILGTADDNGRLLLLQSGAGASCLVEVHGDPTGLGFDMLASIDPTDVTIRTGGSALINPQPRLAATGGTAWNERLWPAAWISPAVLVPEQLATDTDRLMVLQATVLYYASGANFVAGNTVSITDGTTTETWTAVVGAPAGNQFQIGVSITESMDSLCARIAATGVLWGAAEFTDFTLGVSNACVIYRRDQDAAGYPDRIFATSTPVLGVLDFSRGAKYGTYGPTGDLNWPQTVSPLETADPGVPYFGWGEGSCPGGFLIVVLDEVDNVIWKSNKSAGAGSNWQQVQSFTADDDAAWVDPNPTTTTEAINRIAAVVALNHGPIP